jgi:hypothetical protein
LRARAATANGASPPPVAAPTTQNPSSVPAASETATSDDTSANVDTVPDVSLTDLPAPTTLEADSVVFTLSDGTPVTRAEAEQGYLRQKDYTKKTTEIGEQRRRLETNSTINDQAAQFFSQHLPSIIENVRSAIPPAPDPALKATDINGYTQQWIERQEAIENLRNFEAQQYEANRHSESLRQQNLRNQYTNELNTLLEKRPSWKDEKVRAEEQQRVTNYAKSLGFTDADLSITDHRLILALLDAELGARVRKGGQQGAAARTVANPTISPNQSAGTVSNPARQQQTLRERAASASDGDDRFKAGVELLRRGRTQPNGAGK